MSLWVDKYRPRSIEALTYHSALSDELKALAASGDFPHILVYGPSGAGKKTQWWLSWKELYGNGAEKIKIASRVFQIGTSSRKVEFNVVSSNYHIEFTPSDMGNNDRVVIQDLLKEIAQTQSVDTRSKIDLKQLLLMKLIHCREMHKQLFVAQWKNILPIFDWFYLPTLPLILYRPSNPVLCSFVCLHHLQKRLGSNFTNCKERKGVTA